MLARDADRGRGDIVLLDNLRAHKSLRAQRLIEARGASVRFLAVSFPFRMQGKLCSS